jgi:hypothetical protein
MAEKKSGLELGVEVAKIAGDGARAVLGLAKVVNEQKLNLSDFQAYLEQISPFLLEQISSFFDILNSPLGQVITSTVPLAPIPLNIIKLIVDQSKKEFSLEQCVALVSQAAYLESFKEIVQENTELLHKFNEARTSQDLEKKIKRLGEQEIEKREATKAIVYFHESQLAELFNEVLQERLQEAGLEEAEAKNLTEKVARRTNENLQIELVKLGDKVKKLVNWYSTGGEEKLEKRLSIEDYLEQQIQPKPDENIFDEQEITFRDLYVPLQVQPVDDNGKRIREEILEIENWVMKMLNDEQKQKRVIFIQGEAGRGKSVFTKMFADKVRQELHPSFTPILIRLRDLRVLENSLTKTLENPLEAFDFVTSDDGWLTDKNTRFLFLLDGFDELLLEGRTSGGLQDFLQQVEIFQEKSHHRFLVTGRPLALQGIDRLISQTKCLERVELQPMNDAIRQTWLNKWEAKFGTEETKEFEQFLQSCPDEIKDKLAREPLLLYLLARMHREKCLNVKMFEGAEGIKAKIIIYDEVIKWVLEKQRGNENIRLVGLESDDLRRFLTEVALCIVQSGNESTNVKMLEARIKDPNDPIAKLIEEARKELPEEKIKKDRLLNNLLTAFYIKPVSGKDGGSMEFVHKSFGEFLFAERLAESFYDWTVQITKRQRQEYLTSTEVMDKQIYDLLGYGNLTPDIVEYLMGLLAENSEFNSQHWLILFERLHEFYLRWCEGEFIDAPPEQENLPQWKKEQLKKLLPEREKHLGLRQVDVYTGLNVLILLFELHRYAQTQDDLQEKIIFYPCGQPDTEEFDDTRLLRIIGYSQCLGAYEYNNILKLFLSSANLSSVYLSTVILSCADLTSANLINANLSSADLRIADLISANLSNAVLSNANLIRTNLINADLHSANLINADLHSANLHSANLTNAYLINANLIRADLSSANLSSANLIDADLSSANLSSTNLKAVKWNGYTRWSNVRGLHEAVNVPFELAQQPTFAAAVKLSQGMSWVKEGKVQEAIQAYNQALSIDPNLDISAESWNSLGWYGSLYGYAADVLFACEKAVNLEPNYERYYDSRGLAKALTGDLTGSLADFQVFVENEIFPHYAENFKQRRLRWVEALKAGENPFTPEELEALR